MSIPELTRHHLRHAARVRHTCRALLRVIALGTIVVATSLFAACSSTTPSPTKTSSGASQASGSSRASTAVTSAPARAAFNAVFNVNWRGVACSSGIPSSTGCYVNVGHGTVHGLGIVTERYTLLVETANANCADQRSSAVFTVAGKGTIKFALKSAGCVDPNSASGSMNYVATGGSGTYAGVSGSGTLDSVGIENPQGSGRGTGTDTWTGSLSVIK